MANFFYKARNNQNKVITGTIKAADASQVAQKLIKKNLSVIEITQEENLYTNIALNSNINSIFFSVKEKKEFLNSFYFQYKSGLSVQEIFRIIADTSSNKNIKIISSNILNKIESGEPLKEAFSTYSDTLGKAYTMLICAGEESGKLDEILSSILKNLQKEEEIKNNIISSLSYPIYLFLLAIGVFILFKTFVLKVFSLFIEGVSNEQVMTLLFSSIVYILLAYAIIIAIAVIIIKNNDIKKKIYDIFATLPLVSNLLKNYYFQNFFMVLALSYEAGIPMGEAVSLANNVINIESIQKKIYQAAQMINKSCEIQTAFTVANVFSHFAISQTATGEKTGKLDATFKVIAHDYEQKLDVSLKVIMQLLQPITLIIVGSFVAYIAITAYTQYYNTLFSMF